MATVNLSEQKNSKTLASGAPLSPGLLVFGLLIFGSLTWVVGLVVMPMATTIYIAHQSKSWVKTEATLVKKDTIGCFRPSRSSPGGYVERRSYVQYAYSVGSIAYSSYRVSWSSSDDPCKGAFIDDDDELLSFNHPVGSPLHAWVNPVDPTESVIRNTSHLSAFDWLLLVGLTPVFLYATFYLLVLLMAAFFPLRKSTR